MKRKLTSITAVLALTVGIGLLVSAAPTIDETVYPHGVAVIPVEGGVIVVALDEPYPTGTPTAEATATATPSPTHTPTPSPTPDTMPLCDFHDDTSYHALVAADGSCHYDHEHKHDPNEAALVSIFGPAGEWLDGGSISYPWETAAENQLKHEAYGWVTRTDIPSNGRPVWIHAFRVQGHVDATPFLLPDGSWSGGYLGRFHSYSVEAQVCRESDGACGVIRFAGWLNYGDLEIEGITQCAPLPDLHPNCPHGPGGRRIHFDTPGFPPAVPGKATFFWYGEPSTYIGSLEALNPVIVAFSTSDTWNEVTLATLFDPAAATFCIAGDCPLNGSTIQQHVLQFRVKASFDSDGDGLADFNGYTDRYGREVTGCTAVSLDCVPLVIDGVPIGLVEHRDDRDLGIGPDGSQDFDTSPAGEWWIGWPND